MRYPLLSFLELQRLSKLLRVSLDGARIDRIFIPECSEHPQGFFKNELVLETRNGQFFISLRAQACGVAFLPGKTLRPSKSATHSGFDLTLHKTIEGLRIQSVSEIPGDRMLQIRFSGSPELSLFLNLLPAIPEGTLVSHSLQTMDVIASSKPRTEFVVPPARDLTPEILAKVPDRKENFESLAHFSKLWMDARRYEAITLRKQKLISALDQQFKAVNRKVKSLEEQAEQSRSEPNWNYFGQLLQMHLHSKPTLTNQHYSLFDYEKDEEIQVPGDEKLNLKQQLEKYFHQAKRNKKKLEEATSRIDQLRDRQSQLNSDLNALKASDSLEMIQKMEGLYGSSVSRDRDTIKKIANYTGKMYQSAEGLTILSGRSKDENLELTFKVARGNDLWLHVKGRPGSHTIILLPPKKSASLETLLDAANLCILHSGGKEWGKTEVDYTLRKFVKKIKNQSDVSYSENKTLIVTIEPERLKRLYGE